MLFLISFLKLYWFRN